MLFNGRYERARKIQREQAGLKDETEYRDYDGEKLYETLMTREERLRAEDMGDYFRVFADNRDLNYDKYFVQGKVMTEAEESYTSHNTKLLDVDGVVKKILTTDYVREQLGNLK